MGKGYLRNVGAFANDIARSVSHDGNDDGVCRIVGRGRGGRGRGYLERRAGANQAGGEQRNLPNRGFDFSGYAIRETRYGVLRL